MKPPYFLITAVCRSTKCGEREISKEKRLGVFKSTSGHVKPIENLVCPVCHCWATVTRIEEVTP